MSAPAVIEVHPQRLGEVVEVLAEAFVDYEAMRYLLGADGDYPTRLRTLIGYFTGSRLAVGSPVLGVSTDETGRFVAAALVDPPNPPARPGIDELARSLGQGTVDRMARFGAATAPFEPEYAHYYLGMIGVADAHRGKGYAKLLINRVAELSERHLDSQGVLLTTEHEPNVALYQSLGFTALGDATTTDGHLHSWTMFRPNPAPEDR